MLGKLLSGAALAAATVGVGLGVSNAQASGALHMPTAQSAVTQPAAQTGMRSATTKAAANSNWKIAAPPGTKGELMGVSCRGEDWCMAITTTGGWVWNGHSWSGLLAFPDSKLAAGHISCSSSSYCVAVGETPGSRALAYDWNGHAWRSFAFNAPAMSFLSSVDCISGRTCMILAGYSAHGVTNAYSALARGDVMTMSEMNTPSHAGFDSVSCPSTGECVAVGSSFKGPGVSDVHAAAMRYKAGVWTLMSLPNASTGHSQGPQFYSVDCTSLTACTVVGSFHTGTGVTFAPLLAEHWNGSAWHLLATPSTDVSNPSISCAGPTTCTAVGSWMSPSQASYGSLIQSWKGGAWSNQRVGSQHSYLSAISQAGQARVAVGFTSSGGGPLVLTSSSAA